MRRKIILVLAALCGIALSSPLAGCSDQEDAIPDGHPPTLDAGTDGTTVEIDGGTDGTTLDICEQQSPPPEGGYTLTSISWKCGPLTNPGDTSSWDIPDSSVWSTTAVEVQPMEGMCGVTIPDHTEPMDYTALTIMRSGGTFSGPFRFYFGVATNGAGTDFVCWDRSWPGQMAKQLLMAILQGRVHQH